MSLHDAYARVTPFELAFPAEEDAAELLRAVEEEAEARGVDAGDLGGFLTLGSVEAFVRETAGGEADPTILHRFGPVVYHGVRFAEEGKELHLLTTHVARYLVGGAPDGDPGVPGKAGYLQLPQHLFWTRAAADAPESIDGIFWSVTPGRRIHVLLVTGVRPDRPGVGVVPLPEAPVEDAPKWLEWKARDQGDDFATELPGAEIDGLYEIQSAGEVFKLLARFFAYLNSNPDAAETGGREEASQDSMAPDPSRLDFTRVTLGAP